MRPNRILNTTGPICLFINVIILISVLKLDRNSPDRCSITLNENQTSSHDIPDDFLSFGIDTSLIQHFEKIPFSNAKFLALAAALAPARLRIGGTMSERLIFSKEDLINVTCEDCENNHDKHICPQVNEMCKKKFLPFFLLTGSEWIVINEFCKATNLKLLFSLNVLLRNQLGWDDTNAIELLSFTKFHDFKMDFQLGNEPNSFLHTFNESILPRTLAHDFKNLRSLLKEYGFEKSLLVGPDTTRPQPKRPECLEYMTEFLGNVSNNINVRSWHQYYLNSRTATLEDFWAPETLDLLKTQIETMKNETKKYNNIPMWLTETSSSYGGGAPGLSNTYAGTPLWLDKLGLAAKYNITTVIRQSFFGGNYSLVDENLNPLPDWWVSVLYKKLVGNKVLNVNCHCTKYQRLYAHCTNRNYTDDNTAVTIFGINLQLELTKFKLNGTALHGDDLTIDEFIIRAPSNNRESKYVLFNGFRLDYDPALELKPRHLKYGDRVTMPPYSIAFWVIKNTSVKVCQ